MKKVFQCDFCSTTRDTETDMELHEPVCSFNPINKQCWTCEHRTEEGASISGFWNGCNLHNDIDHIEDFGEKGLCKDWKTS